MFDDDPLKQETDALQQMIKNERKLLVGSDEFIKGKIAQGVPRERAYALVAEIFRGVREVRARDRRRTFRVI